MKLTEQERQAILSRTAAVMPIDEPNYGADPWREPKTDEGDTVLFTEHGRVLDKTDYRSHWFMLVKVQWGGYNLLVHHGGGHERISLGYLCFFDKGSPRIIDAMKEMDTDARYLLLHSLYDLHTDTRRREQERASAEIKLAFVEGRLKKRKIKGQSAYEVKVEPRQPGGPERLNIEPLPLRGPGLSV